MLMMGCNDKQIEANSYSGYVEGRYSQVSTPQSGWIQSFDVAEGDNVTTGQALFSLDSDQQQILLSQATAKNKEALARLNDAKTAARLPTIKQINASIEGQRAKLEYTLKEKQRWLATASHDYASKSSRDNAVANYDIALAKLDELKQKLAQAKLASRADQIAASEQIVKQTNYALKNSEWVLSQRYIKAHNSGNIDQIYYHQGEFVNAGSPILSLLINNEKRVRFFLPQQALSRIKLQQKVNVSYDDLLSPTSANIVYIAKDAEFTPPVIYSKDVRSKLVFMVEAQLPSNSQLLVGQPVEVSLK